jgi:hypothetical protein
MRLGPSSPAIQRSAAGAMECGSEAAAFLPLQITTCPLFQPSASRRIAPSPPVAADAMAPARPFEKAQS